MLPFIYDHFRKVVLKKEPFNWESDKIWLVLSDSSYVPSIKHKYISDIPETAQMFEILGRCRHGNLLTADDFVLKNQVVRFRYMILVLEKELWQISPLICIFDAGTDLSTAIPGELTIKWDESGILSLN